MTITAARVRRYVFQRSGDLVLSLYRGAHPADADWVLAERWVRAGEWRLGMQVVGASHVAVITRGDSALTEALVAHAVHGSAPPALFEGVRKYGSGDVWECGSETGARSLPHSHTLSGRRIVVDTGAWVYAQEVLLEKRARDEMDALEQDLLAEDPDRLAAAYPAGSGGGTGVTALSWEASRSRLRLQTYHTYPDEGVVVTTEALCRMRL